MNEMDYWRFTPHYTILEAAALIVGVSPENVQSRDEQYEDGHYYINNDYEASQNFQPVYVAIKRSLIDKSLACANIEQLTQAVENDHHQSFSYQGGSHFMTKITLPILNVSRINAHLCKSVAILTSSEISSWLKEKGISEGFFFPSSSTNNTPSYLNKDHPCFAPKLYAAVRAWEGNALDHDTYGTPKQQMTKWLEARAAEFGLVHDTGGVSHEKGDLKKSALVEICSVANWNQDGGRSAKEPQKTNLPPKSGKLPLIASSSDDNDLGIPF